MALKNKSLFLYGFQVTELNSNLDFRVAYLATPLLATLRLGYYSLTSLGLEITRAMNAADPDHIYTVTVDRTVSGGLSNRVTISSSGTYFSLLFFSGPRAVSSIAPLIGFSAADLTGALTYQGTSSAGTSLIPSRVGYNYLSTDMTRTVQGVVTTSASGEQESITFQIERFWEVEFKYEPEPKVVMEWMPMMTWIIQHRLIEFTPDVTVPGTFYEGTIERTGADGKGLGYKFTEQKPDFPFNYTTGLLTFRQRVRALSFI
jgi:hypothetical protein